ncbi:sensor histidine kinase [Chitinophaga barathri]|nr:histidine kinase [Chitinophaga barathri]
MAETAPNKKHPFLQRKFLMGVTWLEVILYSLIFVCQGLILVFSAGIGKKLPAAWYWTVAVDSTNMALACLPGWWLVFRKYKSLPLRQRFLLHLYGAPLFMVIWFVLMNTYHYLMGNPLFTGKDILHTFLPTLTFYVQVFSILHIYHFYREREAQLKKEKELAALAFNSEINALKAQIQPHFLFNTLNSISASVPPELEPTRELIARLADTFRYSLYCTEHEWVPLHEEIRFIRTMLEVEHSRFKERLEFDISPLNGAGNTLVPSMLLQPLVENAIRHGIGPSINGGRISIEVGEKPGKLEIRISDTGVGYPGDLENLQASTGVGLKNTRQRLELLFSETIHITRNEPSGLTFTFYIHTNAHATKNSIDH